MPDVLTGEFRWTEPPLHGSLEALFDLMESLEVLAPGTRLWEPVRPIEGVFLL